MKIRITYCASEEDEHQLLPLSSCQSSLSSADNHCGECKCHREYRLKIYFDELIFTAACMILLIVFQLPMTDYHGKPVPIFIFGGLPAAFHAFLICLMGACCGSVCSIHIRKTKPKIARFYYAFAVLSMVASFLIALCAGVWEIYKAFPPVFALTCA